MTVTALRAVVAVSIAIVSGYAQEFDPHDPGVIALVLDQASEVVVGKFGVARCWPWLDG